MVRKAKFGLFEGILEESMCHLFFGCERLGCFVEPSWMFFSELVELSGGHLR